MTRDGSSSSVPPAAKAARPLARVSCALRGAHAYVPSRKLDGYETCAHCGHRRKAEEADWFAEANPAQAAAQAESRLRPLAMMGCTVRGYHNFMPSRRMEGYDTCIQCGFRKKAARGSWFAAPPPKSPSQAAIDAGPVSTPEPAESKVVIPFDDGQAQVGRPGVDPKVLRSFLRQIDSGAFAPSPAPSRRKRKSPEA